jgi:hypothetical protein
MIFNEIQWAFSRIQEGSGYWPWKFIEFPEVNIDEPGVCGLSLT